MSWSVSSFVPAFSAPIFETDIAPMTTSARIIAPKAMPRRYASRKLLKRDIRFLPGKQVVQGAPAAARRFIRCLGDRPHPRHFECSAVVFRPIDHPRPQAPAGWRPGTRNGPAGESGRGRCATGSRRVLRECLADGLDDARRLEGLDDEVLRAELDGLEDLRLLAE